MFLVKNVPVKLFLFFGLILFTKFSSAIDNNIRFKVEAPPSFNQIEKFYDRPELLFLIAVQVEPDNEKLSKFRFCGSGCIQIPNKLKILFYKKSNSIWHYKYSYNLETLVKKYQFDGEVQIRKSEKDLLIDIGGIDFFIPKFVVDLIYEKFTNEFNSSRIQAVDKYILNNKDHLNSKSIEFMYQDAFNSIFGKRVYSVPAEPGDRESLFEMAKFIILLILLSFIFPYFIRKLIDKYFNEVKDRL